MTACAMRRLDIRRGPDRAKLQGDRLRVVSAVGHARSPTAVPCWLFCGPSSRARRHRQDLLADPQLPIQAAARQRCGVRWHGSRGTAARSLAGNDGALGGNLAAPDSAWLGAFDRAGQACRAQGPTPGRTPWPGQARRAVPRTTDSSPCPVLRLGPWICTLRTRDGIGVTRRCPCGWNRCRDGAGMMAPPGSGPRVQAGRLTTTMEFGQRRKFAGGADRAGYR
jgi:hypothetical protein